MTKLLYWIGCLTTYRFPKIAEATVEAFMKMKENPVLLGEDEGCCGDLLLLTGQHKEAEKNAKKVVAKIESKKIDTLVTGCAGCYRAFTKGLKEVGITPTFQVLHTSQFLENQVKSGKLSFKPSNMKVTYHDPCELGRLSDVYDPPRNVLNAIPGLQLVEMATARNLARCCGAGGGAWGVYTELAEKAGRARIINEAVPTGAAALVTACPSCYMNFYRTIKRERPQLKIYDLMEIVNMAL